jgi:penicillin V acylase-like amidase (Ntn superfamily)
MIVMHEMQLLDSLNACGTRVVSQSYIIEHSSRANNGDLSAAEIWHMNVCMSIPKTTRHKQITATKSTTFTTAEQRQITTAHNDETMATNYFGIIIYV